jgi:hypothetical protein
MPPRIARTSAEAEVFLTLLPCERCTATETDWNTGALYFLDDGGRAENYAGRCLSCGNVREIGFELPEPADGPVPTGGSRFGGAAPSGLLDPAEWLRVAGTVELASGPERRSGTRVAQDRLERLEFARDAYLEALKFIPAGADAVPESALFSDLGRDRLRTEPESLTRDYIHAQLRSVEHVLGQLRRDRSAAPAGTAGPPPPRFDLPEDAERARRWLRDHLLHAARAAYPHAQVAVERDDGPVAVSAVPDDQPADYTCAVDVALAEEGGAWDAEEALTRVAAVLADDGWEVSDPRRSGWHWAATGERAGFVVRLRMSPEQGVLRLSGETPLFFLAPVRPPAGPPGAAQDAPAAEPDDDEPWVASSEQEEILELALQRGDRAGFFALLRRMPLYVPVSAHPDDPAGPVAYGTVDIDDRVHLATYTSLGSLRYGLGEDVTYRELTYQQLVAAWPDPQWRLAVNAGSPIEVYAPVEEVAEPGFRAANDVERELHEAVARQDWNLLIAALTRAPVPVLTRRQVTDVGGKPSIAVYTSPERAADDGADGADLVAYTLTEIVRSWPDRSYQLVLNPGSTIATVLPAEAIPLIAEPDQA